MGVGEGDGGMGGYRIDRMDGADGPHGCGGDCKWDAVNPCPKCESRCGERFLCHFHRLFYGGRSGGISGAWEDMGETIDIGGRSGETLFQLVIE